MRVVSGIAKGRKLVAPAGLETRPTADRIKQSLFNMIAPDLEGAYFLDLFAGSGAIGIEALSRGAQKCFFVEKNKEAMNMLLLNLEHTKFSEMSETYFMDVSEALKALSGKPQKLDIIFMDPPYGDAFQMKSLTDAIKEYRLLSEDGYIIGEHGVDTDIGAFFNASLIKKKSYGKTTAVSFWRPS